MAIRQDTLERRQEIYAEAIALIAREHGRDITIDEVARTLFTSRRQLQRVLAEIGRTTFRQALARERMRSARRLLAEGSLPVRVVGASVGYTQPAQFSKTFRRHFGTTPSEVRRGSAADRGSPSRELAA